MAKKSTDYNELDTLRHSCAHVMAHAVKALFPKAKFGVGPAIENGFYYDIDLEERLTEEDLAKIEKKMAELIKEDQPFVRKALPRDEALKYFKEKNETYKLEIIDQIGTEDEVSTYTEGDFTDLCRGPHVESAGKIKAFKLLSVAGAYWRGNESNPMMQRIYGTAFSNPKDLKRHLNALEEAKRRDHRKLGKELELFSFHEEAGPGLVFWHPKGGMLRHLVETFSLEEHLKRDYDMVKGPQILKSDIWKTSGHYEHYKENMFIYQDSEEKEYAIKPMNCPGHMQIFASTTRSYRDLPLRFFEMGNVCRYEKSGVLHGLLRVRNFTQDDAHVFCTPDQLEDEIAEVLEFMFFILKAFGFEDFEVHLSTRPKDSIGSDAIWEKATKALEGALKRKEVVFEVDPEGGAFYGPKIDIKIKDAIGRAWQCSTVQCDFALPERFKLEYAAQDGSLQRPIVLHRAIFGSVERFIGTLVEHFAGAFPLWLSPLQLAIIPIAADHHEHCHKLAKQFKEAGFRVEVMDSSDTLNKKIRNGQKQKTPYLLVVGANEIESNSVNVRPYGSKDQKTYPVDEFLQKCIEDVNKKSM